MSSRLSGVKPFARAVLDEFRTENVTFMAGSIAYQAFVSLLPLLILLFFIISAIGDQQLAARVTSQTQSFLPQSARELLGNAISGNVGSTGASAIGLVTLLWGSLKIFRGLDTAFSDIYDTEVENSFVDQVTDGLVVFVTLGLAIVAAGVATTIFGYFQGIPFIGILSPLFLILSLTIAFFPIYYFFPDMDLSIREVLPGVVVAATGWAALQVVFQIYVSFSSKTDAYGILGAIILLLTWLYFGGLVLLLGAVVNAVIADRTGDPASSETGTAGNSTNEELTGSGESTATNAAHPRASNEISRVSYARILQDMGQAFDKSGRVTVPIETDTTILHPPETVEFSIETKEASNDTEPGNKEEGLTIKARWRTTEQQSSAIE